MNAQISSCGCGAACACGCCSGIKQSTPATIYNRPGLDALQYRIGDYNSFLDTMLARLSNLCIGSEADCHAGLGNMPLQKLTSRSVDDFSIALLHGWATVADVLTFYQERLFNEGYLRTATERRSVLELARLIGYEPRPGVAASAFLAYTLDDNFKQPVVINKGARSQSTPDPGDLPASFETSDDLEARAVWNNLKPRLHRPQTMFSMLFDRLGPRIYLQGISTKLNPDDPLLLDIFGLNAPAFYRVKEVIPDAVENRTLVTLQTKLKQFGNRFDLSNLFSFSNSPQNAYKFILLDSGDSVSGFYEYSIPDENGNIQLYSITNGSVWMLSVVSGKGEVIQLQKEDEIHFYQVKAAEGIDFKVTNYLRYTLQSLQGYGNILAALAQTPSIPPRNSASLAQKLSTQFFGDISLTATSGSKGAGFVARVGIKSFVTDGWSPVADAANAMAKRLTPNLVEHLATATSHANITQNNPIKVFALRAKAAPFGYNAPLKPVDFSGGLYHYGEWPINDASGSDFQQERVLYLDADYPLLGNSWMVIDNPNFSAEPQVIQLADNVQHNALAAYGISGKTTKIVLDNVWFTVTTDAKNDFKNVRNTRVFLQSEALELADEPLNDAICGGADDLIELNGYYENLQAGRWVIVSGERANIPATTGVRFSELAMLSVVQQDVYRQALFTSFGTERNDITLLGDQVHSFIKLAKPLSYCFKRDTIKIYGNVVKATHGETRQETLGSGNGAKNLQSFTLKQSPLTFTSANNPAGVDSTLTVRVNGIAWHESKSFINLHASSRNFITKTGDDSKTTILFGNGKQGARLPTGAENIRAEFRTGIGKLGNVKAEKINMLVSRPLGVKDVINPLRASGGADKETRDQARKNAPLTVAALDRLVSVRDYQDFSRIYAGIGKACAAELSDGRRQIVHVTIAGADDVPIDESADLFINLRQSLHDFGDPFQAITLAVRELLLVVVSAKIKINPDYQWELVSAAIRVAMLDALGFERRELGQDVVLSEIFSVMQAVDGVEYVDVDAFGGVPEKSLDASTGKRQNLTPAEIAEKVQTIAQQTTPNKRLQVNLAQPEGGVIRPAQIAFLTPDVPETLILNQIL